MEAILKSGEVIGNNRTSFLNHIFKDQITHSFNKNLLPTFCGLPVVTVGHYWKITDKWKIGTSFWPVCSLFCAESPGRKALHLGCSVAGKGLAKENDAWAGSQNTWWVRMSGPVLRVKVIMSQTLRSRQKSKWVVRQWHSHRPLRTLSTCGNKRKVIRSYVWPRQRTDK